MERASSMNQVVSEIINRAREGTAPTYEEVVMLIELDETSSEATAVRNAANDISRERHGNAASIWGQIGIDVYPCEADCQFCSFAKSTTVFTEHVTMPIGEVVERAKEFTKGGDLFGLYLMTMNSYDEDYYLECVKAVRAVIPAETLLYANIGDTDQPYFEKLKAAGLDGVYHAKRLGEGTCTNITPERREATIRAALAAGLRIRDCCEPVGAETSAEDIATRLFEIRARHDEIGGLDGAGVMKRTSVPGTCYEGLENEITDLRLALLNAIQAFTMVDSPCFPALSFHEPNFASMLSGGNYICAETGFNPRDTAEDTAGHHGIDVPRAREMFYQAGFRWLMRADGSRVELTSEYMKEKLAEA